MLLMDNLCFIGATLEELKQIWIKINESWNLDPTATAYEFKRVKNIKAKENIPKQGENHEDNYW